MTELIAEFRRVLSSFCSGVTVVTAAHPDGPAGMTCQSFFSLSLDPPLVAFSPAVTSTTYPRIRDCAAFVINILAEEQAGLAAQFARSGTDKWVDVRWQPGATGAPVLDGTVAAVECTPESEFRTGDHFIVVGRVQALTDVPERRPLLYFQSAFSALATAR